MVFKGSCSSDEILDILEIIAKHSKLFNRAMKLIEFQVFKKLYTAWIASQKISSCSSKILKRFQNLEHSWHFLKRSAKRISLDIELEKTKKLRSVKHCIHSILRLSFNV